MGRDRFREAAKDGRTLLTAWLTLNSPFLIELIGEAGFDCITVDQQHGIGGNDVLLSCLTAARAAGLPAIVRVAENDPGLIGRALDAGAQGIMGPMIETVEDAEAFVRAVKYPPIGQRSWGPYRARLDFEGDYFSTANNFTIACPQIETKGALDCLDDLLAIEGLDMICLGPNDLVGGFDRPPRHFCERGQGRHDTRSEEMPRTLCHDFDFLQRPRLRAAALRGGLDSRRDRHRCRLVFQGRRRNEARRRGLTYPRGLWPC